MRPWVLITLLSSLTSFVDTNPNDFSRLAARGGGKIIAPNLVDLDAVSLLVDGAGQLDTAQITNLNKAEVYASGGGGLAFPQATTYVDEASFRGVFRAESGGSIDLSAITAFTGHAAGPNTSVQALSGGSIDLSSVETIDGGAVNFDTHGDPFNAPKNFYHGYGKGRNQPGDKGELVAAFDGKHGWFWRNRDSSAVTVTVQVRGEYAEFKDAS